MIIHVKNKNTLKIDDFIFKCCVGKNGFNTFKQEGDLSTPKGIFKLKKLYYRKDRVSSLKCKINKKIISKNIAWCDDATHKKYNQEINVFNEMTMGWSFKTSIVQLLQLSGNLYSFFTVFTI